MKLSVIGGGGIRSMFLAKSLTQRASELNIDQIVFMDNDERKLNIYGEMAKQVARRIDPGIRFSLTTDPVEAIEGADYVITTIRVGGDQKRIDDETIALDLGVLGQETTGAAGFSFAMRSIPALVEYCELIRKYANPGVKVFNFTNPAGLVSQVLRDMDYDFTFGICDGPSGLLRSFAGLYGVDPDIITGECYGINHLSFFEKISINGKDILPDLINDDRIYRDTDVCFFEPELIRHLGQIPIEYLYYYFYREEAVDNIKRSKTTRGTVIRDINLEMSKELSTMNIAGDFDNCLAVFEKWYTRRESSYMSNETGVSPHKPPFRLNINDKDAGGYAGAALRYIEAEQTGKPVDMVLCVPNNGAVAGLADTDVVEVTCTITQNGPAPHGFPKPARVPMEWIRRVKAYERWGSEAIRTGNISLAVDSLMAHPLVNSYSLAKKLVDRYLVSNKEYIKGWK